MSMENQPPFLSAPPDIRPGDFASYLRRATWAMEQAFDLQMARADIDTAMALAPDAWEPWEFRARWCLDDAALALRCLDEAIARGADLRVRLTRARQRAWIGQLAAAEDDYSAALLSAPGDPFLHVRRAEVRAHLGRFSEALEDVAHRAGNFDTHERRVLRATLQWIVGDFAVAYREFTSPALSSNFTAFFNIWSHLCQVAHGAAGPLCESVWAPRPAPDPRDGPLRRIADGASSQTVDSDDQWDLLLRLFEDQIDPSDVLNTLSDELQLSDAWQPPASPEGVRVADFMPCHLVWRGDLQFYVGMWHLSHHDVDKAAAALAEAAGCRRPASLERLAAAAQLRRLDRSGTAGLPRQRLLRKPLPSGALDRFLASGPKPSSRGPRALQLNAEGLFDEGLRLLLQSPHLRVVERLELRTNGLTAAAMEAFRDSAHLEALTYLDLSENRLGDVGLKALLQGTMPSLRTLNIEGIDLTDDGAELLTRQPLALSTLMLGNTPIDLSIWRRLARRYGEGLYARGAVNRPYDPPFDRSKVVDFVSGAPGIELSARRYGLPLETSGSRLRFCVTDCVALELCRLSRLHVGSRPSGSRWVERSLRDMSEEERRCASWPNPHKVNSVEGYLLLLQRVEPLELYCDRCDAAYRPPFDAVRMCDGNDVFCPAGHLLYRAMVIP